MIFSVKRFLNLIIQILVFSPFALIRMLTVFLYDFPVSRWSYKKLPGEGLKIGLKHKKSEYIHQFGSLEGTVNDCFFIVEPFYSMNPRITIQYKGINGLELSLRKPTLVCGKGIIDFSTTDEHFNKIFKTKRVGSKDAERFIQNEPFIKNAVSFYIKWIFDLDSLIIDNNEIICTFRYGFFFFPHIPVSKLVPLVKDLEILATSVNKS